MFETRRLSINPPFTDTEFAQFCAINPNLQIDRNPNGVLILRVRRKHCLDHVDAKPSQRETISSAFVVDTDEIPTRDNRGVKKDEQSSSASVNAAEWSGASRQRFSSALEQASMNLEARVDLLRSGDLVTAAQIAEMLGSGSETLSPKPDEWKRDGLIFAITLTGVDHFPLYTLNPLDHYRPYQAVGKILRIFGSSLSSWEIAFWFMALNSFFG